MARDFLTAGVAVDISSEGSCHAWQWDWVNTTCEIPRHMWPHMLLKFMLQQHQPDTSSWICFHDTRLPDTQLCGKKQHRSGHAWQFSIDVINAWDSKVRYSTFVGICINHAASAKSLLLLYLWHRLMLNELWSSLSSIECGSIELQISMSPHLLWRHSRSAGRIGHAGMSWGKLHR